MASAKIKVLVVDDSAVVREVLSRELSKSDRIEVVGTAPDPYVARDKIIRLQPDAMTLDVEMPRMDGLTFLRKIMEHHPLPTIVVSSLTPKGSDMAMDALAAGAVDVLCKPGVAYSVGDLVPVLSEMLVAASLVDMRKYRENLQARSLVPPKAEPLKRTTHRIFAIGASTGGTQAIERVLLRMPVNSPGIVIVQHMPIQFTKAFADRLNANCSIEVREAKDGDHVLPGLALIAPGNQHMRVVRKGGVYAVALDQSPRVHFQRPAVDNMFHSLTESAGSNVVAALLTGMGKDGAEGLLALRRAGAYTIAQDENSCVVYGMPREAIQMGAAEVVLPLDDIAGEALRVVSL